MSIIDPSEVGKARAERDRPSRMDQTLNPNQGRFVPKSVNTQAVGHGVLGAISGGLDPAYEAELRAQMERDLRQHCIYVASNIPGIGANEVTTRAKEFYDFIKGN